MRVRVVAMAATAVAVVTMAEAQTVVTGTVRVVTREGIAAPPAVVYAQPLDRAAPPGGGAFTLAQKNKSFQPAVIGVPVGATVAFPNQDAIFHNVFSLSAPAPFDLGLYRAGASRSRTFREAATYRVFCNIHPQMTAVIVVAPTPFVTVTARDGSFTLTVPAGRYRVTATTGRGAPVVRELALSGGSTVIDAIEIDERSLTEAPHTNKFGKPYPKEAYRQ